MKPLPARFLHGLAAAILMAGTASAAAQGAANDVPGARRAAALGAPLHMRAPLLSSSTTGRSGPAASVLAPPAARSFGQAQRHDSLDPVGSGVHGSTLTGRLKNAPRSASPWRATMRFELSSREQLIIKPRPRRVTIAYQATL
jgi:hypothetical protein